MTNLDILKESMLLISKLPLSTLKEIGGYLIGWVGAIITQKVLLQGKMLSIWLTWLFMIKSTVQSIDIWWLWLNSSLIIAISWHSSICWLSTLCFYLDDLDILFFYFLCWTMTLIVNLTFCCFALTCLLGENKKVASFHMPFPHTNAFFLSC